MGRATLDAKQGSRGSHQAGIEPGEPSQALGDIVDYIRTMTEELRVMAEGAQLQVLAYCLDMARLEAEMLLEKTTSHHRRSRIRSGTPRRSPS